MLLNYEPVSDAFRLLDRMSGQGRGPASAVPMDVRRLDGHVVATLDLPGADPGSIDVTVEGISLTIRAERSAPHGEGEWLAAERPHGTFGRRLMLGRDLDPERLTATYRDGVLTLTVPVADRARPRRIQITHDTGETSRQAIDAGTTGDTVAAT